MPTQFSIDDVTCGVGAVKARRPEAVTGCGRSGCQRSHAGAVRIGRALQKDTDTTNRLIVLCLVCSTVVSACGCTTRGNDSPSREEVANQVVDCTSVNTNDIVNCNCCLNKMCDYCLDKLWGRAADNTGGSQSATADEQLVGRGSLTEVIDVRYCNRLTESDGHLGDKIDVKKDYPGKAGELEHDGNTDHALRAGRDLEAGHGLVHPGHEAGSADWLRIVGPSTSREREEGLFCTIWAVDKQINGILELEIDIFGECLRATCECEFSIKGAVSQIRPCRVFAECMCRGDSDPDWSYILKGACFGFKVIDDDCDSEYCCGNYTSITKEPIGKIMTDRLREELDSGLLTVMKEGCVCIHALGSVPKGDDDFRAIVDCSSPGEDCVNDHTWSCRNKFCYNSVDLVTSMLQRYDVLATVDISNAYRAINTHPDSRERQGLAWDFGDGKVFMRDNRLCMGLSSSPYVFSKISDFIVRCLVREGFEECVNYLDDFCLVGRDEASCGEAQWSLVEILRRLGFYVSYKKLTPPHSVSKFLGIEIDSLNLELRLPNDKLDKLHSQLKSFMSRRKATKLELEGLGGILAHCCKVVKGGRTFSRRVYDLISSVKRNHHKVRLSEEFRLDLRWWLEFAAVFNGKAKIIPPSSPTVSVYSDASLTGFGATHGDDWLAGGFGEKENKELLGWLGHHFAKADDIGCKTDNINVLELWPILQGVRRWSNGWEDTPVIFVTDNTQVQAALNTGRSKNKTTMAWLRLIFWESVKYNFEVSSVYINTKDNTICDSLSRLSSFKNIARIRDADEAKRMCCHHVFNC